MAVTFIKRGIKKKLHKVGKFFADFSMNGTVYDLMKILIIILAKVWNFSRSFEQFLARTESGMQFRWPKEFLINNDLGYDVFQISK